MPGKKKKKGRHKTTAVSNVETEEELLALAAIYGDDLDVHHDGLGFDLTVVPHPGMLDENLVSVQLSVRYPHQYPAQPLTLKLKNPEGLRPDACRNLLTRLVDSAAEHAAAAEVCVFNLVDMCQDELRTANEQQQGELPLQQDGLDEQQGAADAAAPGGDQAHAQSLWHSMQRRNGSLTAEGQQQPLERQGSLLGSLAGADVSGMSLVDDMTSVGLVGGLSGAAWQYDGGLYDLDDSGDMETGMYETPSAPVMQSPPPPLVSSLVGTPAAGKVASQELRAAATTAAAAAAATTLVAPAGSPKPESLPTGAAHATRLDGGSPGAASPSLESGPGHAAATAPAVRNGKARVDVAGGKDEQGRKGSQPRRSPFIRQPPSRPNRISSAVLARRLPRAMRALVASSSTAASVEEGSSSHHHHHHHRPRGRTGLRNASGGKGLMADRGTDGGQGHSDGTDSDSSSSGDSSGSSGSGTGEDGRASRQGAKATVAAAPGRLWATGSGSSTSGSSETSSASSESSSEEGPTSGRSGPARDGGRRGRRRVDSSGGRSRRHGSGVHGMELQLLLGHLLTLAAAGQSLDARGSGLDALCAHLRRRGLLPHWVQCAHCPPQRAPLVRYRRFTAPCWPVKGTGSIEAPAAPLDGPSTTPAPSWSAGRSACSVGPSSSDDTSMTSRTRWTRC